MDLGTLFGSNRVSNLKIVTVPDTRLSKDQLKLFNGLHEIGGDITKYDDAIRWYKDVERKNEALAIAVLVLDKPASYLFGGVKNKDAKDFLSALPKMYERIDEVFDESNTDIQREMK
eukprot:1138529_1